MKEKLKKGCNAFDLFPGVLESKTVVDFEDSGVGAEQEEILEKPILTPRSRQARSPAPDAPDSLEPPEPPDTTWLPTGVHEGESDVGEVARRGLIFITSDKKRSLATAKAQEIGFEVHEVFTAEEAIAALNSSTYSLVVCDIEDAVPTFHEFMKWMPMVKRRVTYYTLVGKRLHTLYDLEALSLSANMVVADRHLHHLGKILAKGFVDYEQLFAPLLEELQVKFPPQF